MQVAGVPVLHPADHDTSPVGGEDRLRRVEVDAVVHGVVGLFREDTGIVIAVAQQVEGPVPVVIFKALRKHVLGAGQQHVVSVETEEIRALPHEADAVMILRQRADEAPMNGILAAVLQNLPALAEAVVGDQSAERAVGELQNLWITEIKAAAACG